MAMIDAGVLWTRKWGHFRRFAVLLVAVSTLLLSAAAGTSHGAGRSKIAQTSCFWTNQGASRFGTGLNYAFPDSGAVYCSAKFTMPPGSKIVFKGEFAHARYESLNSYEAATNAPIDAVNDISTRPDKGSTNPFRPSAHRDDRRRSYTLTLFNQQVPPAPAPNTLYAGMPGQTVEELIYRVYVPDSFTRTDLTGGVGLPVPQLHLADGTVQVRHAACAALHPQSGPLALTTLPKGLYQSLRDQPDKPATFPAAQTPVFRAYYNTGFSIDCGYDGECSGHPPRAGGQYSNIDNDYAGAFVNRGFAAGPVLVLRGELPTTPRTRPTVTRMQGGQMRYWSMCQNESV